MEPDTIDMDQPAWKAVEEHFNRLVAVRTDFAESDGGDKVTLDISFDDPLLQSLDRMADSVVKSYACRVCTEPFRWEVDSRNGIPRIVYRPCMSCGVMRTLVLDGARSDADE